MIDKMKDTINFQIIKLMKRDKENNMIEKTNILIENIMKNMLRNFLKINKIETVNPI